jgi:hypothetical protein
VLLRGEGDDVAQFGERHVCLSPGKS